jgi:cysteine desulfurase
MSAPRVYLDHVASTPLDPRVRDEMARVEVDAPGNPSSLHREGRRARDLLEASRDRVAATLRCRPREIVFTSGGTEAINLGLVGVALARQAAGATRIVTSAVEHAAVLDAADALKPRGFEVVRVPCRPDGSVDADEFAAACVPGTALASLMCANHETGAVMPVAQVAERLAGRGVPLHCDAALGPGLLDVAPDALETDVLALSAHKWNGPRGAGVLYVRRRTKVVPLLHGGVQEERLRPGAENVAAAVGLATALERAHAERTERSARYEALRARLEAAVLAIPGVARVGPERGRLPTTTCVEVEGCEGESMLVNLDLDGFAVSTGSACAVGSTDASPVLLAMGLSKRRAASTIRFSVGEGVARIDVDRAAAAFRAIVERLRALAR